MNKELVVWIVVGLLSAIGVWRVYDYAYNRGVHSRDAEVAALVSQVASAAVALNTCNDTSKLNQQAAEAQRRMADAALDAATQRDKGRTKELTQAIDRLRKAQATPDCKAAAEVQLCEAMSSY